MRESLLARCATELESGCSQSFPKELVGNRPNFIHQLAPVFFHAARMVRALWFKLDYFVGNANSRWFLAVQAETLRPESLQPDIAKQPIQG